MRTDRPDPLSLRGLVMLLFAVQILCSLLVIGDRLASWFGLRAGPLPWDWVEALELLAVLGLLLGTIAAALLLRWGLVQRRRTDLQLKLASGDFFEVVQGKFEDWGLSPSERDVALFMLRGFSNTEIAELRGTSEGTIKAQSTAVFRKAGASGRPQFISAFLEDLMSRIPQSEA
ncbi:MAG: helix-turn-helix transcriptional regulator [Pseudomonadota bacterium]